MQASHLSLEGDFDPDIVWPPVQSTAPQPHQEVAGPQVAAAARADGHPLQREIAVLDALLTAVAEAGPDASARVRVYLVHQVPSKQATYAHHSRTMLCASTSMTGMSLACVHMFCA